MINKIKAPARFELAISCLLDRRFNQLSHGATVILHFTHIDQIPMAISRLVGVVLVIRIGYILTKHPKQESYP